MAFVKSIFTIGQCGLTVAEINKLSELKKTFLDTSCTTRAVRTQ